MESRARRQTTDRDRETERERRKGKARNLIPEMKTSDKFGRMSIAGKSHILQKPPRNQDAM